MERASIKEAEVLLNPRIDKNERELYRSLLKNRFPGHIWFATSGTTGRFKFAALSQDALYNSAEAVNRHFGVARKDVWVNVLPKFHVGGYGIFVRSLASGSRFIDLTLSTRWSPEKFVRTIEQERGTLSALVPTQVYDLVAAKHKGPGRLRAVIVGGGALDRSLYEQGWNLGWKLYPSYGLTECASQAATARSAFMGAYELLDHVHIRIDQEGYIEIKSPSLLTAYAFVENGSLLISDPKQDGWFKTEDKGSLGQGFLQVMGRSRDFVKIGGESVNLQDVRQKLDQLKGNLDLLEEFIIKVEKDERLGGSIILCVEGSLSKQMKALIGQYNETALPYEKIQRICEQAPIKRNAIGKPL